MLFDSLNQPYAKSRHSTYANNGMVCSSNPLASSAGIEILKKGGNAVDAAIATAAVLTVVEPTSNGLGGDAFAIVWMKNKLYGLNASGYSPENLTIDSLKNKGIKKIPKYGWTPITIPGQPKAWGALIERFGKLSLKEVLEPAIKYAEEGYPLSPVVSYLWNKYTKQRIEAYGEKKEFQEWFRVFTKNKKPYKCGEIVKLPDHAKTLKLFAEKGTDIFYKGEIAKQIVKQSQEDGGYITWKDLEEYDVEWVDPISVNYRGYDIWEIPPNGQGIVTLISLNILKNFKFEKKTTDSIHKQMEAIKMAFSDSLSTITDLSDMREDYHKFLENDYGKKRAKEICEKVKSPLDVNQPRSGTVYLCSADNEGNMVSYIQSNYQDFGSGIVIKGYGIAMQNRGFDFSLDESDANVLKPRKRCYHTIIPGFITKNNVPVGPFGVMGGYMQPQGHLQVIMNLIDFHLNPQMSLDAPRWQWKNGKTFIVEPNFSKDMVNELIKKGHDIVYADNCYSFGRAEMIIKSENNVYIGATESRADGNVAAY